MREPVEVLLAEFDAWFAALPPAQRGQLSRLFFFLITDQAEDFFIDEAQAQRRFVFWRQQPDFPVRRLARLAHLRAVFDLILQSTTSLQGFLAALPQSPLPADCLSLEMAQWQRTLSGWRRLCDDCLTAARLQDCLLPQ
ncbi:hypothetical protein [Desulfuromonas thiophila]|uniref:hypothetical protein n=1 Tax=Desulfuromonas thiophila TaxID=57664 RepID=UPI0024A9158A|nr:hypothetical protein [Desulfuromonas thiophila]